jgi:hypothetical protein
MKTEKTSNPAVPSVSLCPDLVALKEHRRCGRASATLPCPEPTLSALCESKTMKIGFASVVPARLRTNPLPATPAGIPDQPNVSMPVLRHPVRSPAPRMLCQLLIASIRSQAPVDHLTSVSFSTCDLLAKPHSPMERSHPLSVRTCTEQSGFRSSVPRRRLVDCR